MSNFNIEQWPIDRLIPYLRNPRKNDHVVNKMVRSIKSFGFRIPILALSDGEIVDGHLRLKAALALNLKTIPVLVTDDLTDEKIKAFRILVNKSAEWADWDLELLAEEITALVDSNFDISFTGFEQSELAKLLASNQASEKNPNVIPDISKYPIVVKKGEGWILGSHRLLCGDSLSGVDVAKLLQGDELSMIWTDPPYNVNYEGKAGKIKNDKMSDNEFDHFLLMAFEQMYASLEMGGAIYIAHSEAGEGLAFRRAFNRAGFKFSSCLIWNKGQAVLSRGDYHWQHEPILYGWKPGVAHRWCGDRKQKTVLESEVSELALQEDGSYTFLLNGQLYNFSGENVLIKNISGTIINFPKPSRSDLHPTTKPVEIISPCLQNSCNVGDLVGEPFCGSGSTLMACEINNRICRAMEIDPKYAQATIVRWQNYTGKVAIRESDGVSFDELLV